LVVFAIGLFAVPQAFADHDEVTIYNAAGSSTPGCEETDNCFIPSVATVHLGTVVTWENTDTAAHTATSGFAGDGPSGVFDSSLIMAGGSYSHTFDEAGTIPYVCMVHPWMAGSVIVEDEAAAEADAAEAAKAEAAAAIAALEAKQAAAAAAAMAAAVQREPAIDLVDTLSYNISGGSVSSIITNSDDATLVVAVDASDDGELSITMDSNYITAFDDGSYFVLVNNEAAEFSQDGSTLTIPFEAGAEKIEIVGGSVVPEFGTIAMVVLAVAIISIIVITTKTKTQLIPKF